MARRPKASGETERERDEFLDAIGERIKLARVKAGLTQKQLADRIGASASWVYLVEDGQQNAQIHSLRRAAEALGMSLHALLPDDPAAADGYGPSKEADEAFNTVIEDLTRSVGLIHKLNALRMRR